MSENIQKLESEKYKEMAELREKVSGTEAVAGEVVHAA